MNTVRILNSRYGCIAYTSDGQTFLGAGQRKEKILGGHNDLL